MTSIVLTNVDFAYPGSPEPVFRDLSCLLDCRWRTAVVGRNGTGKTTLLRLIAGELRPDGGVVEVPLPTRCFASAPAAPDPRPTRDVVRDAVAPFSEWERVMAACLVRGDAAALERYGEVHEGYLAAGGYEMDARLAREFDAMGLPQRLLEAPFETLSGGEQTRALIVALFLDDGVFPLIDEPTNHLDAAGREALAAYLAGCRGFVMVSHDRGFLDATVDHVLSINAADVRVNQGNYSRWRAAMDEELAHQQRRRARIEADVARLELAARQTRQHAASRESDKYRTGALDKGFIGHRAAKQMKRARSVERRIESELGEKRGLLANAEKPRRLTVSTAERRDQQLVTVQNLTLMRGGVMLGGELSFSVSPGERIALVGPNGCGKTTLLDALCGNADVVAGGLIRRPGHVSLGRGHQHPIWHAGSLREHLADAGLDETRFRSLLGVLGVNGDIFERDLASFSQGDLKKVDLCRCLSSPVDVLVLDEPLNYVDLYSREQFETAVLENRPTLVFVEHDRIFVERLATSVIRLGHDVNAG